YSLDESADLGSEGAPTEGTPAVAVDAQAQGDHIRVGGLEGALDDRVELALSAEAQAAQIPAQPAGDQSRPGEARPGSGSALADRTAVGDPPWPPGQWCTVLGTVQLQRSDGAISCPRQPEAEGVVTRRQCECD